MPRSIPRRDLHTHLARLQPKLDVDHVPWITDARAVYSALLRRFAEHGPTLHPEKMRLIPFRQPLRRGLKEQVSFDFLGFTHTWMKSVKGIWVVRQTIGRKRLTRVLWRIRQWMREHRHDPIEEQHRSLGSELLGLYAYFGLPGNAKALASLRDEVRREWKRWLGRRSWKGKLFWERFRQIHDRFPLPRPHIAPPPGRP